jgi:serine protease Do
MLLRRFEIPVWSAVIVVCIAFAIGGLAVSLPAPADLRSTFSVGVPPNQEVGVIVQDINPEIAAVFGLKQNQGVVVTALDCGTLQAGDVILSINGLTVGSRRSVETFLTSIPPTDTLVFQVSRGGETRDVTVQRTGVAPPENQTVPSSVPNIVAPGFRGVMVENLSSRLPQGFDVSRQGNGIIVTAVDKGTPADAAGLRITDTILEVNNRPVWSVEQFINYLQMLSGQRVVLTVVRQGIQSVIIIPSLY